MELAQLKPGIYIFLQYYNQVYARITSRYPYLEPR